MLRGWHLPNPWTGRLSPRLESSLRQIARLFNSINDVVVDNRYQTQGPDPKEWRALRLQADADTDTVLRYLTNPAVADFWTVECSLVWGHGEKETEKLHRKALASLHDEVVDLYGTIQEELEQTNASLLIDVSNSIRWKLAVLKPVFLNSKTQLSIGFRKLPDRKIPKEPASGAESPLEPYIAPAIIAITTLVTFTSFIPLFFAWYHSPPAAGTTADPDFFFLIQNSIMQLLGIFTTMYPISINKTASKAPWYWALFFTMVGTACALAAPVTYLYLPTFWSGFLSFAGTVAQVAMAVQLVLFATAPVRRDKRD